MIVLVCGFGRCGTSMLMQMLQAGGMPVVGDYPAFEVEEVNEVTLGGALDADWLRSIDGSALKVLDPQNGDLPRGFDYVVLWLNRDHREQARSQAKFLQTMAGIPVDRDDRRALQKSYAKDMPKAIKVFRNAGVREVFGLTFEAILARPLDEATKIATYLRPLVILDPRRMASVVLARSPKCMPDLSVELGMIAAGSADGYRTAMGREQTTRAATSARGLGSANDGR